MKADTDLGVNPDPLSGAPGAHPVAVGVGALGGAAAGATVGAIGGPVGAAMGTLVGAVAGALAGKGTGEAMHPTDPETGAGQGHSVGTGMGTAGGGAAGAAIGSVAGPVGTVVGAVLGAVAGGLAGEGVAEAINPSVEDEYWRRNYAARPYVSSGARYDTYQSAYEMGWLAYEKNRGRPFEEVEDQLRSEWLRRSSSLAWDDAREAARDAWQRVERRNPDDPRG
jgi:outer membrane lipoprotein SlyB